MGLTLTFVEKEKGVGVLRRITFIKIVLFCYADISCYVFFFCARFLSFIGRNFFVHVTQFTCKAVVVTILLRVTIMLTNVIQGR